MTLLITGASGYIGGHLSARLTANGHRVLALMRQPERLPLLRRNIDRLGGRGERLDALAGDLDHPDLGLRGMVPDLEAVVHLGARFAWNLPADQARRTNTEGGLAVARLARRLGTRLVYVSGFMIENAVHMAHLGIADADPEAVDWARVYRRAGHYEASKLEGALRVRDFARRHALDWVEVQPATVSGHSVSGDLHPSQPLYTLIDNLARGRLAMIPGGPDHWLPLIPVDALAALLQAAALKDRVPERLLALDRDTPRLADLLGELAAPLQRRPPRRHLPLPVLRALLRIPGLPGLMNTAPEALNFIQTTRFDTTVTEAFIDRHQLPRPSVNDSILASATRYAGQRAVRRGTAGC